jgi:hypothetical protein
MIERTQVDILLVEDNPALDYLFARGERQGRGVADRPRLILPKPKLPKVDGRDALKAVKDLGYGWLLLNERP